MNHTSQPGLTRLLQPQAGANHQQTLQIGRVVGVHQETDSLDVELLQGGRLTNVPILRDLAGRAIGVGALPAPTAGYGTATPTGGEDVYAVVGYLHGQSMTPVVVGLMGPKDGALRHRPEGSSLRRDIGGQVTIAYPDGTFELRLPGASMRIGSDDPIAPIHPHLAPPSGAPATLRLVVDACYIDAPGGFYVNGVPPGGSALSDASPAATGASAPGVAALAARADHVHAIGFGAAVGQPLAAAGAAGVATVPARADHVHPRPTPAEIGAATVGHTHTPAESGVVLSDALPAATGTAAPGVATTFARADHVHAIGFGATVGQPLAAAGAAGAATVPARADHVHPRPTPAEIGAATVGHVHTAAEVGALPIGGGVITGDLTVNGTFHGAISTEAWVAPTLLNGWTNLGSGSSNAGYSKDRFGNVRLRGVLVGTTINTVCFTLPAGYRPVARIELGILTSTGLGRIQISASTGNVLCVSGGLAFFSFDGITFPTT